MEKSEINISLQSIPSISNSYYFFNNQLRCPKFNYHSSSIQTVTMRSNKNRSQNRKKRKEDTSYHCFGCRKTFNAMYSSPAQFVKNHMELGKKECQEAIFRCESCKNPYMSQQCFNAHLTRTNHVCKQYYREKARRMKKRTAYVASKVPMIDLTKDNQPIDRKDVDMHTTTDAIMIDDPFEIAITESCKLKAADFKKTRKPKKLKEPPAKKKKANCPEKGQSCNNDSESLSSSSYSLDDSLSDNYTFDSYNEPLPENVFFVDDEDATDDVAESYLDNSDHSQSHSLINVTECAEGTNNTNIPEQVSIDNNPSQSERKKLIENLLNMHNRSKPPSIVNHALNNNNVDDDEEDNNHDELANDNVFDDENLLLHIKAIRDNELPNTTEVDVQYQDGLELVKYLLEKDISLSSYNDLMKWKHSNEPLKYHTLEKLKKLSSNYVYGPSFASLIRPKKTPLRCPSGRLTSVITSDVVASIVDLLSDLDLTDIHNTTLSRTDEDNPFNTPVGNMYSDIHQGELFLSTRANEVTDASTTYHVGLILYQDEATLDAYSKLSFHPINLTLTLYNREARNLSMTWRTIAYLPNFDEQIGGNKKYTPDQKLDDFHCCLNHVLTNLRSIQTDSGMKWKFIFNTYPDKVFERNLIFRFSHIVSDAKENDMICGRMSNRSRTKRLCRDCDILVKDSDDPSKKCNFLSMFDIQEMTQENLREMSFKFVQPYNAFRYMNFGKNPYGINGATPAEPLHQILGGVVERLPTTLFSRLTETQVKLLDNHVSYIALHFSRQSDRDVYNLRLFQNGISSVSKLTSKEKAARLLIIYLVLISSDFEEEVCNQKGRKPTDEDTPATIITRNEYNSWVLIFEETLIFVEWVYLEEHPKAFFNGGRNSVVAERLKEYMRFYRQAAMRKDGMGLQILKFHQIIHLWWIIRMYGSLLNIDSGRGEHSHKKKKKIGSHTQKRVHSFNNQTANSEFVNDTFMKAMKKVGMKLPTSFEMISLDSHKKLTADERNENMKRKVKNQHYGSKFILTFDYDEKVVKAKWSSPKMKKKKVNMPDHILQVIYSKYEHYNHGSAGRRLKSIECFTQYEMDPDDDNEDSTILFRACPSYRNSGHWFDWAIINWGEYGFLEGQILLFMNFGALTFEEYDHLLVDGMDQDHDIVGNHRLALVHSTTSDNPKFERAPSDGRDYGTLVNRLSYFKDMEKEYNTISLDNISQPCAVYVDKAINGKQQHDIGCAEKVIVLTSMRTWYQKFIDYESQELLEEASQRVDNEYPVGNMRHLYEG